MTADADDATVFDDYADEALFHALAHPTFDCALMTNISTAISRWFIRVLLMTLVLDLATADDSLTDMWTRRFVASVLAPGGLAPPLDMGPPALLA